MPIIRYLTAALTLLICLTQLPLTLGIPATVGLLLLEHRVAGDTSLVLLFKGLLATRPRSRAAVLHLA